VDLDGKLAGKIAFAPFRVELGALSPGQHKLDITAYGNRFNAFGILHNTNEKLTWVNPAAWRSEGVWWAYVSTEAHGRLGCADDQTME